MDGMVMKGGQEGRAPVAGDGRVNVVHGMREEEEEEEEEEVDSMPAHFSKAARELLPEASTRSICQAWDRTRTGIKGDHGPESPRFVAALEYLFNEAAKPPAPPLPLFLPAVSPPPSPPRRMSTASIHTKTEAWVKAVSLQAEPDPPSSSPVRFGASIVDSLGQSSRRIMDKITVGFRGAGGSGLNGGGAAAAGSSKNRNKVLNIDDEEDNEVIVLPPAKDKEKMKPAVDLKGKGKARVSFVDDEVTIVTEKKAAAPAPAPAPTPVIPIAHHPMVEIVDSDSERGDDPDEDESDDALIVDPFNHVFSDDEVVVEGDHDDDDHDDDMVDFLANPASLSPDQALSTILDIIPDVVPSHVIDLLRQENYKVPAVMEILFSKEYPKVVKPATKPSQPLKRMRSEDDLTKDARMYRSIVGRAPVDANYLAAAAEYLSAYFSMMPVTFIRRIFVSQNHFFAPTFFLLVAENKKPSSQRIYKPLMGQRNVKGKGKEIVSVEFEREKRWVRKQLMAEEAELERQAAAIAKEKSDAALGLLLECECCSGEYSMEGLVQCADAHLFCRECAIGNANTEIGKRQCVIACPSGDGCIFTESELSRFLPESAMEILHKTSMEKSIDGAGLAGLSKCPFCPFACVIENDQERLFRCLREGCEVVSCRQCQKVDHLPKTCVEANTDNKIEGLHQVEEAMTNALIRKCPKCSEPYVKESGCNKISCPSCRTLSCFICGKIVAGYDHFTGAGSNSVRTEPGASCALWDDTAARTFGEVEAARIEAAKVVAKNNPAVEQADLHKLNLAPPLPPAQNIQHLPPPVFHADRAGIAAPYHRIAPDPVEVARAQAAARERARLAQHRMLELQRAAAVEQAAQAKVRAEAAKVALDRRRVAEAARLAKRDRLLNK